MSFFAAPTMLNRVVAEAEQKGSCLPGLHSIIYGGAPMYLPDIKRALDICGPRFTQIYGQGEAPMTITALSLEAHADTLHPAWERRLASVGVPRTNVEVRVVNEEDHPVPAGATGEVVCKGDVLMTGYWRDEGASRQAIVDGWLHTGDIGAFDGDGFLTLKDRSKDSHYFGRLQHLSARSGGSSCWSSWRFRGGGGWSTAPRLGRRGSRLRCSSARAPRQRR